MNMEGLSVYWNINNTDSFAECQTMVEQINKLFTDGIASKVHNATGYNYSKRLSNAWLIV